MKKIKFTILIGIFLILWYMIFFTTTFDLTYEYVRLKSGTEFRNQKVKWTNKNTNLVINDNDYSITQIDSISENPIRKKLPKKFKWLVR